MRIAHAVLALGLFLAFGRPVQAADLYPYGRYSNVWFGGDCCSRGVAYGPGIRVVEQVPYCGDCDDIIGQSSSRTVRLRYFGYPVWERGCALGGCYGGYGLTHGCYLREVPRANGRGWVLKEFCD